MISYEGLSVTEATRLQKELQGQTDIAERQLDIHTIGGADISLNLYSTTIYAGIILLSFPSLQPVAFSLLKSETRFPYVPGYLAFREVPALVQAWQQIPQKPDLLLVDGHGIAHPRRMGIATHFGIVTGQPAMGCAKKILCGKYEAPGEQRGASSAILDREEQIGYAFRSKAKTAPVFVSPGHRIGMDNCLQVIRQCIGKYRIPEPTRLAHELVNRFRKGALEAGYHRL
jgi:deoxyribonuclease V